MENEEYIDFNILRGYINVSDTNLFTTYLKEVFKDLADRQESSRKKGVSRVTFLDYVKLPVFIAEKLFSALDQDKDTFLSVKEFVDGLRRLYLGNFEETAELIFNIFDFDKDGLINKGDIKILLSYLPLKKDRSKVEYKFQMESLDEIDEILNCTFQNGKESLKLPDFIKAIEVNKSDVYLQLLCFLYQNKPFQEENVNMLKVFRRKVSTQSTVETTAKELMTLSPQKEIKRLPSPNRKSVFSPVDSVLKITLQKIRVDVDENLTEDNNSSSKNSSTKCKSPNKKYSPLLKKQSISPQKSDAMASVIRMPNQKIAQKKDNDDLNTLIKNSKNVFNSPSNYLKKDRFKNTNEFNIEENLKKMEEFDLNDNSLEGDEDGCSNKEIMYENWIYKLSETLKVKKYWLVLIGKDIYYYKSEKKEELLGMHNLSGCFVKESGEKKIHDEKMFCFSIIFPGKTRNYYCYDKNSAVEWSLNFKKMIGYSSFFDHYEMLEDIGEGKFGLVKLGLHKKTKEKVAIKIIKKESMTNAADMELVKSEIDIMKLCRHPNVVKLLDHFENSDYIFIAMEYLPGGDLGEYLNKIKFNISEIRAAYIMYQLACGCKYLHQYGIIHRDLKPDNILLTDCSDKARVKIMDFGLSKIIGPEEKVADGFGTLSFVAPEVLIRQPYGKQIDIWSLGVILYFMLSGTLPFDDENDNEEVIAKMTVYNDVQFPSKFWNERSYNVIDLINQCLIKDPNKRISIDAFLAHPWIVKNNS